MGTVASSTPAPCHAPVSIISTRVKIESMPASPIDEKAVLAKIRVELEAHLRRHGAPEDVRDFLTRHWARLMTGIYLAKGNQHADLLAGWDTVNALLWSLSPRTGRKETDTMMRVLPTLLERLHQGCVALALPVNERDTLFEHLAQMHAAIAREGLKYPAAGSLPGQSVRFEPDRDANLAELVPPLAAPTQVAEQGESALPMLAPGSRVMLAVHGEERLMVLKWISPVGGMYLFTNEQGLDALTFTRVRLLERFRGGRARLL